MRKIKVTILNAFPKHSALWKYAFFIQRELGKDKNYIVKIFNFNDKKYSLKRWFTLLFGVNTSTDVLICVSPLLANSLKKSNAKTKIVIVHDLYPLVSNKATFFEILATNLTYPSIKFANKILAVSKFCKKEIIKKYNFKNIIVQNGGVDHTVFKKLKNTKKNLRKKYGLPIKKKILLHVGRDDPRKNLNFIIKILALLNEDFLLLKIGEISRKINNEIKNLGLEKRVVCLKNLSEKELCEIYNAADLMLFPSKYEGLGLPPAEAMACGLPVIAANNTGLKEVCLKESLTELNKKKWIKKINKFFYDNNFKKLLIKKGIVQSKKFDWKLYAENLKKIIHNS